MPPRSSTALVVWRENRGRNGWDLPTRMLPGQVAEALNITLERGTLGRKRYGTAAVPLSGEAFNGLFQLHRHVPGQNDTAAEVFLSVVNVGATAVLNLRMAAGTTTVSLTMADACIGATHPNTYYVTGNGKCFVFYDSAVNRGHVYDPATSTTEIRRMGLAAPGAPSGVNQGSGSYPQVLRYYRIQWVRTVSGATYLQSNLGAAGSVLPSGVALSVRVTPPTPIDSGVTHWIVWVSADNITYYQLSETLPIATTFYDDTTLAADYPQGELAPEEGAYTPFPSCKWGLWTGDRLLGFGVWETESGDSHVPKNGTVYFSPVLDSTSPQFADDERCSNSITFKGTITVARDGGAEDRAIAGPLYDEVFVFQSRGVYALTPTGQSQKPYLRAVISPLLGAVSQDSTFVGEDEFGRPCIYFLDPGRGPYRYGPRGMQWLGYDVQDLWETFRPVQPQPGLNAHGTYDSERRRVIWTFISGSSSNYPTVRIVFAVRDGVETPDGVRYGWTRETVIGNVTCLAMLPTTLGATMSRQVSPYHGLSYGMGAAAALVQHQLTSATDDTGTAFQGVLTSPVFDANAPQYVKAVAHAQGFLLAKATAGVEVQVAITQNYGDRPARTHQVNLSPRAVGQTRITARIDGLDAQELSSFQVTIGDQTALAVSPWTIDEFGVEVEITDQFVRNS